MDSNSATKAPPHQHPNGVFDFKKVDESDIEYLGTAVNEGSETKEDKEPSPRQIHGIKVRASEVNAFEY